jgi:UDP-4-amino-4,6-dideoxy-N-acetyl-beta-L-altrosamine transaminase
LIPYGKHHVTWGDALRVLWQIRFRSLTQGPKIEKFEAEVAKAVGVKYAVAVSSATAGLHLAALALKLPPGSKVITSPISFVASSNSLLYAGYKPEFLDIDPNSLNLDLDLVKSRVEQDNEIKAILPVHFAGLPCDMEKISEIAHRRDLRVIEDAAHALGAEYQNGAKVGSCEYSDMTVLSFHPVKSITTGEGGMVTTNDYDLYKSLLRLRSHGINKLDDEFQDPLLSRTSGTTNPWYYEMIELGYNYRMTEIQAALGISQLKRLEKFMAKRFRNVSTYSGLFQTTGSVRLAQNCELKKSANHILPVRIDFANLKISRATLMNSLRSVGVGSQVHYIPIPMQPYYKSLGYDISNIPEAVSYYEECLSLPLFPNLSKSQQKKVVKELAKLLAK